MNSARRLAALVLLAPLAACTANGGPTPTAPVRVPGRTVFVPHAGVPFDGKGVNAVWCATFPMAWHALGKGVFGGPVALGPPAPPDLVEGMNARPFPEAALDPAARVVEAGLLRDGVLDRIGREGREKFGLALPRMPLEVGAPEDLLAYAFLRKDLPFEQPFEPIEGGIRFAGGEVPLAAFGINGDSHDPNLAAMRRQTTVLFHGAGEEGRDMALEIRPKGGRDVLLLAAVPHLGSLESTWRGFRERLRQTPAGPLADGEVLAVPKIHFDLTHRFAEFEGAPVLNEGFREYLVTRAVQAVLFRLDEEGVLLESEAVIEGKLAAPMGLRHFVFDRPFLVALRQEGAEEPYFLLWIANPDLMPR